LYLALWEEGAKGPGGKSSRQKLKAKEETFEMLRPGIPEKSMKGFSVRKGNLQNNNPQGISWWMGGLIMSRPIRTMGM
jgi:hypothetical protein